MQKYFIQILCGLLLPLMATAQKHTDFVGVSLAQSPEELTAKLVEKGLQRDYSNSLSGRIAGLEVWLSIGANKDTTGCSHLVLTTRKQQGVSLHEDYAVLMKWMQKHYGKPTWESTVRSHRFARWYIDYDHDIVMIATAQSAVEIWFYENHSVRNIDYYSILKYCERNPNDDVPYYTAEEQVTWKSTAPPEVSKKKFSKRRKASRRHRTKRAKSRRRRR
jgi:hypothetical protein